MDDGRFALLQDVVNTMVNEGGSIESSIIKIIDRFERQLDESQKSQIFREFMKYEKRRVGAGKNLEMMEKWKHAERIDGFFRSDEI